jgi:indole-3-glycerol phosphate synthase
LNTLIGINNRNLENFQVDLNTTIELVKILPEHITIVSESGIQSKEDISRLKSASVDAVLVGEHLMRSENTAESLQTLKGWCSSAG